MKANLEFNLNEIDERDAHIRAVKADNAYRALYEISELFRRYRKYGRDPQTQEELIYSLETEIADIIISNTIILQDEYK
jgi:hypothetical protein